MEEARCDTRGCEGLIQFNNAGSSLQYVYSRVVGENSEDDFWGCFDVECVWIRMT